MAQEEREQYEDEINLMDYVKVILKRKRLILGLFFGAAIAAGVLSFLMPKVYKIDTSLEVGRIEKATQFIPERLAESPTQLVGKIEGDVYGIKIREKLQIPEDEWPKIKVENPKGTNLVTKAIESSEPEKAKEILEEGNKLILAEHQEMIEVRIRLINENIRTTEEKIEIVKSNIEKVKNKKQSSESDIQRVKNKIETLREDIESTRNKIEPVRNDITRIEKKIGNAEEEKANLEAKVDTLQQQLVYEQTPGTQFALFDAKEKLANKKQEIENLYLSINSLKRTMEDYNLQISSLERSIEDYNSQIGSLERGLEDYNIQINSLENQIGDYQAQINSLRASLEEIRPTEVVKKPTISEQPVKPKKKLNIVIGGVLGLFVGVFWAFGKEWWQTSSKNIKIK